MSEHRTLPVWRTAVESWRFLLQKPQAALLTMVLAALWLHAVLRAASVLSRAPYALASGSGLEWETVSLLAFAVSGIFALAGWLILAALLSVLWARAAAAPPAVAVQPDRRSLARAVGLSALALAALAALWLVSVTLIGLPFGVRTMMVTVNPTHLESFAVEPEGPFRDPTLLLMFGTFIVAAFAPVRLALMLPAIARGEAIDVGSAWTLGRGNGWRLLAIVLVVLSPVWLAGMVVDLPFVAHVRSGDRDWVWWARSELDRSLNGLLFALFAIVVALSRRALNGPPTDTDSKRA